MEITSKSYLLLYICSDGHYIEFQKEVLVNNLFSKEEITNQLKIYEEHNGSCKIGGYHGDWISTHTCPNMKEHNRLYTGTNDLRSIALVQDCMDDVLANSVTAVFGSSEDLYAAKEKLPENWAITAYDSGDIRMDVHLEGFSKGTACEYLYKHLNIHKDDSYAFGDGDNDIEMLQLVGNGIAMGNAAKHIQEVANDITDTVDNEGIAKAFKKYLAI